MKWLLRFLSGSFGKSGLFNFLHPHSIRMGEVQMIFQRILYFVSLLFFTIGAVAQKKALYHPCHLMDSVDTRLDFIRFNAARIFDDTSDCRQELLNAIALKFTATKEERYLAVLSAIRQNTAAKVEEFYTDPIRSFLEDDFSGFLHRLYLSNGKYLPLEKELVAAMNMIVGDRPMKQKYMGLLNVEISKASDKKDIGKFTYLKKLQLRIEQEKVK